MGLKLPLERVGPVLVGAPTPIFGLLPPIMANEGLAKEPPAFLPPPMPNEGLLVTDLPMEPPIPEGRIDGLDDAVEGSPPIAAISLAMKSSTLLISSQVCHSRNVCLTLSEYNLI